MSNSAINNIKGLIFDIDGTLILHNKPLAGAIDTINALRQADIKLRFVSNATGQSPEQLAQKLQRMGFKLNADEIQTSVTACRHLLTGEFKGKTGYIAIPDASRKILADALDNIQQTEDKPDFVLMGDLGSEFDYHVLNKIFNYLLQGAQLITFHRNPYIFRDDQTWLDSGAFTMAFETITKRSAIVTGKPFPALFDGAAKSMGLSNDQVLVVGDDISADIPGAINAGMTSALVCTGKFKPEHLSSEHPQANLVIQGLPELLDKLKLS